MRKWATMFLSWAAAAEQGKPRRVATSKNKNLLMSFFSADDGICTYRRQPKPSVHLVSLKNKRLRYEEENYRLPDLLYPDECLPSPEPAIPGSFIPRPDDSRRKDRENRRGGFRLDGAAQSASPVGRHCAGRPVEAVESLRAGGVENNVAARSDTAFRVAIDADLIFGGVALFW